MPYVTTRDDTRLYVKDWGAGRPVILIHGWPLSADSWDAHAMAIAGAGMRAISYDRRGFGRSSQPWGGYDYDTLSDDLAAVIEATGAKDATLVGFSMAGGEVARYMSRHAGQHVVQAGLIASIVPYMIKTADNPHGVEQATFDGIITALEDDRPAFLAGFFENFYGECRPAAPVSDQVREWSRDVAMTASLRATIACVRAWATDFRADLLSAFAVPTLVVHGTDDRIVPIDPTARAAARAIAGAKLLEYDGGPHGLLVTHRQRLADDLLEFLRS
jgi:non-heme chloroperoxidase